jgi:hypothetical protein
MNKHEEELLAVCIGDILKFLKDLHHSPESLRKDWELLTHAQKCYDEYRKMKRTEGYKIDQGDGF